MSFQKSEEEAIDEGLHIETNIDDLTPQVKPGLVGHTWKQRGPFLYCQSCPLVHSVYIGVSRQMIGINDDGTPKFRTIK